MKTHEKISKRLQETGQSQKWLAMQVGVSEKRISLWLKGTGRIPPERLKRIAEALGLPIDYLSDPEMEVPPAPIVTADEMAIVEQIRYWGLSREEAIDCLSRQPHVHGLAEPKTGSKPKSPTPTPNSNSHDKTKR
jgi:transcriptional regulator with XRE-family HTH domain